MALSQYAHPIAWLLTAGLFAFIGVSDLAFVRAEGLGVSPDVRKAAMDAAAAQIEKLAT